MDAGNVTRNTKATNANVVIVPNEIKIEDESPYTKGGILMGSETTYEERIENGEQNIEDDEDNFNREEVQMD